MYVDKISCPLMFQRDNRLLYWLLYHIRLYFFYQIINNIYNFPYKARGGLSTNAASHGLYANFFLIRKRTKKIAADISTIVAPVAVFR